MEFDYLPQSGNRGLNSQFVMLNSNLPRACIQNWSLIKPGNFRSNSVHGRRWVNRGSVMSAVASTTAVTLNLS